MPNTFLVRMSVSDAIAAIEKAVLNESITGELIDEYSVSTPQNAVYVLVFEKHYWRVGNRLTLTVTIDDCDGSTRVHTVGGGGGEGIFRFDWGASGSFEDEVRRVLERYQ